MKKRLLQFAVLVCLWGIYRKYLFGVTSDKSFYDCFVIVAGTIPITEDISEVLWNMAVWLLPQICIIVMYADFLEKNVKKNYSVILTRTNNINSILNTQLCIMIRNIVVTVFVFLIEVVIIAMCTCRFITLSDWIRIITESINICLVLITDCVIANYIAVLFDSNCGALAVIGLKFIQFFLIMINIKFSKWLYISGALLELRTKNHLCTILETTFMEILYLAIIVFVFGKIISKRKNVIY